MYKVFIKCAYVEMCFNFDSSAEAINFMGKAVTRYSPEESEGRKIKVWMEVLPIEEDF